MGISYQDGVSIGLIVYYVPALALAIYLFIKQRFFQSWRFLVVFTVARLLTGIFELAASRNPSSEQSLYAGYATLLGIGLTIFEGAILGLLSQVLQSVNRRTNLAVTPNQILLIQVLVMLGLILGIVGGIKSVNSIGATGGYTPSSLSKAAVGIYIVIYLFLLLFTFVIGQEYSRASRDEKRMLIAIVISLPFVLVRLIWSAVSTFGHISTFNFFSGDETITLVMVIIMEAVVVFIFEAIGVTLEPPPPEIKKQQGPMKAIMSRFRGR